MQILGLAFILSYVLKLSAVNVEEKVVVIHRGRWIKEHDRDIPFFKTASGQRKFYYRTIGLWNNLDPFLKSSCSVQVFERILKNKLLDNFVNTP